MCGIIGFVRPRSSQTDTKSYNVLAQGLFADTLRGSCGTGVAVINKEGAQVFKRSLSAPDFLRSDAWEKAEASVRSANIVMGHNRAATIGSAKDYNAHPFTFTGEQGEITLIHNGTLNGYRSLVQDKEFKHDVDSAWAAKALTEREPKEVLGRIDGWYVLVWWNATKRTFNIARNSNRDIWWIKAKNGVFYYASEHRMLDWLLARNGVELSKNAQYEGPNENEWYEWKFDEEFKAGKVKKHDIVKIVEPNAYNHGYYSHGGWSGKRDDDSVGSRTPWTGHSVPTAREREIAMKGYGVVVGDCVYAKDCKYVLYDSGGSHYQPRYGYIMAKAWGEKNGIHEDTLIRINGVKDSDWKEWEKHYSDCFPVIIEDAFHQSVRGKVEMFGVTAKVDEKELKEWDKNAATLGAAVAPQLKLITSDKADDTSEEVSGLVPGPFRPISIDLWREYTLGGCSYCSAAIEERDFEQIKWMNHVPPAPFCHECSTEEGFHRMLAGMSFGDFSD